MGSRSSGSGGNKSTSTNNTQMSNLQRDNPATTMAEARGNQRALQSSLMEQVMPAFSAMMQMGQQQMNDNPMLKAFGQPSEREMATLQDVIASMQPQQPMPSIPQPQPQTQQPMPMPQQPYAPFGQMSEAEMEMLRQNMPKRYGFGGLK